MISKAAATVTLSDLEQVYDGTPKAATVTTGPAGVTVDVTYDGSVTPPTEAGDYAVVATINDPNYQGDPASGTLVITDITIVAEAGGPYLGAIDTAIPFDGSGSSGPENVTYAWTFGDGATGEGIMPAHSYAAAGIYDVCLTVSYGALAAEQSCTIAVVYDPEGGFVTGGGWIDSPVNMDYPYMQTGGKATFGFVAKYKKGANVPDGNTQFQLKAGDLNFHSTSYQWLVVAGTKAQFKGEGTINGQGSYKFMISANDGTPDTFRIKIWHEENDIEAVVYDNGSQQALGGGSIVVHKAK